MGDNEFIGIAGVFLSTICLIALYHFICAFGRHGTQLRAHTKRAKPLEQSDSRTTCKDDDWFLWDAELDERAGPSKPDLPDHREARVFYPDTGENRIQ